MPEPRSIRCGILCTGHSLPRWQARAIQHLMELANVEIVVLGVPDPMGHRSDRGGSKSYLDHRALHLLSETAALKDDLSEVLSGIPAVELQDLRPDAIRKELTLYAPEILFSLLPPLEQEQNEDDGVPIWQFMLDDQGIGKWGLPAMDVRFQQARSLPVRLIRTDGRGMLEVSFPLRDQHQRPTLDPWLLGAAWLPSMLLSQVRRGTAPGPESTLNKSFHLVDKQHSISSLIYLWFNLEYHRFMASRMAPVENGSWNIGLLHQPITALLEDEPSMNVRWLPAPSGGNHRMEPFGYTASDGQLNVLYRKRSAHTEQDIIARLRPKSDSVLKRSRSMLSTSASLTYPYIVERPDGVYALIAYPHQERTELFRVAPTNDGMDHIKILLNRALINPTLTEFEGRWWLFGMDPDAPDSVLLGFHAETFDGPYQPHALNPLKVDVSGSRPAGGFFRRGSELWRPAIDASEPDIPAVILNRITRLTPLEFAEEPGKRITGFKGTVYGNGVRTLSAMGDITLIDGIRKAGNERSAPSSKSDKRQRSKRK